MMAPRKVVEKVVSQPVEAESDDTGSDSSSSSSDSDSSSSDREEGGIPKRMLAGRVGGTKRKRKGESLQKMFS
jgi:hypothetical protein